MTIHLQKIIQNCACVKNSTDNLSDSHENFDFENDLTSFAKFVHYCESSETLSLFIFEFSKNVIFYFILD